MKKIIIVTILFFFIVGCANKSKNETVNEDGYNIPKDIYENIESIKDKITHESYLQFTILGCSEREVEDIGRVYDIYYGVTACETIQLRMLYDYDDHSLCAICIILADNNERDNPIYRDKFNNFLKPAFLKLDFRELFNNRDYKKTEKSDDENDENGKLYLEYVVDQ